MTYKIETRHIVEVEAEQMAAKLAELKANEEVVIRVQEI